MISESLDRLRRPEYTGRNRCLPCTLVNLVLVGFGGAVLAIWHWLAAPVVVLLGLGLLGLRGYVVPGTPRFAPRLVDPLPVDFGHSDQPRGSVATTEASIEDLAASVDPEDVLEELLASGVLQSEGGEGELFLDEEFRAAWNGRMETLGDADNQAFLDRVSAVCPGGVQAQLQDGRVLLAGDRDVLTNRAIAIAETAAIETLRDWDVPEKYRVPAAPSLRNFLRSCPNCGGPIQETTRRNCCGGASARGEPADSVLACEDCASVVMGL